MPLCLLYAQRLCFILALNKIEIMFVRLLGELGRSKARNLYQMHCTEFPRIIFQVLETVFCIEIFFLCLQTIDGRVEIINTGNLLS